MSEKPTLVRAAEEVCAEVSLMFPEEGLTERAMELVNVTHGILSESHIAPASGANILPIMMLRGKATNEVFLKVSSAISNSVYRNAELVASIDMGDYNKPVLTIEEARLYSIYIIQNCNINSKYKPVSARARTDFKGWLAENAAYFTKTTSRHSNELAVKSAASAMNIAIKQIEKAEQARAEEIEKAERENAARIEAEFQAAIFDSDEQDTTQHASW